MIHRLKKTTSMTISLSQTACNATLEYFTLWHLEKNVCYFTM